MPTLEMGALVEATGGTLLKGAAETTVRSFSIDTRNVEPGAVFFALRGTRTDGHAFLDDAARRGAAAAVVDHAPEDDRMTPPAVLQVPDTVSALGSCGKLARKRFTGKVIALTGSAGKTTTKELVAAGLSANRSVHRTPGNLNNHLGVPLTLLACPDDAEMAVIEMGMNAPGEIAFLTQMADPDVALVTNVRPAHLEFFRSLDDIAAAKGELFAVMRDEAVAVVNLDDAHLRLQAARHDGPRVTFGRHSAADVQLVSTVNRFSPGVKLEFRHEGRTRVLELRIGGIHAALDAIAAIAAVVAAGEDPDDAAIAMTGIAAAPGRGRVYRLEGDVDVVDESYNSNPAALASVLDTLRASAPNGRKFLVLGDMLELGAEETTYHNMAGELAAGADVQVLVGVGPRSRVAVEAARKAGVGVTRHEENAESAAKTIPGMVRPGDLVVVKGSRGVHLELVVNALVRARGEV